MAKFLNDDGLLYVWQKIKVLLEKKVDKVEGKGLSTNDLTNELLEKINSAGSSSFSGSYTDLTNKPTLNGVQINGTMTSQDLGLQPRGDYANAVHTHTKSQITDFPTGLSQFTNDTGFQNSEQVQSAINSAIGSITHFHFQKVDSLPPTGEDNVIYLVPNTDPESQNLYDEFLYVDSAFEKIGETDIDLSNYWSKTDLVAITNGEIDDLFV